jgi:CCT motif
MNPAPAVVYCDADACFLCAACDEDVHQANRFAQRHVRRPVSTVETIHCSDSSELLVPDVSDNISPGLIQQQQQVNDLSSAEAGDIAYADFDDFESVAFAKMPALTTCDSDNAFFSVVPTASLRAFDADDLSWEAVVPIEFDHVVPDVEAAPAALGKATPVIVKHDAPPAEGLGDQGRTEPVTPTAHQGPATSPPFSGCPVKKPESPAMSCVTLPSDCSMESSEEALPAAESDQVDEVKTAEQRKQMRVEALARFRSKRASRNFQKKIRYNCRKMLADSRPRVKGRFVKKSEMALYRRYGAEYREHLNEAITVSSTSVGSSSLACS